MENGFILIVTLAIIGGLFSLSIVAGTVLGYWYKDTERQKNILDRIN